MDAEKLTQSMQSQAPAATPPKSFWSIRRLCALAAALFALALSASWWLTPISPYATLNIEALGSVKGAFSADGSLFATWYYGMLGKVRVWDVASGDLRFSIDIKRKTHEEPQFSPDNKLLAVHEEDDALKLWDVESGRPVAAIGHFKWWVCFRFSPDGRFLIYQDTSGEKPDPDVVFWNLATHKEEGRIESYFFTLVIAPDGRSCATYRQKDKDTRIAEVLLWNLDPVPALTKKHRVTASANADLPGDYCGSIVAISHDLKSFASADDLPNGDGEVVLWDTATGQKRASVTFPEHGTKLKRLSFRAKGKILAAYGVGGPEIRWQSRTTLWEVGSQPKEIGSYTEEVADSPNGRWLAVPLDDGAKVVNVSTPNQESDLVIQGDKAHRWEILYLTVPKFSPDSSTLSVKLRSFSQDKILKDWLPKKLNPFPERKGESSLRIWDAENGRDLLLVRGCSDGWFSPNGKVLATVNELDGSGRETAQYVKLWKLPLARSPMHISVYAITSWLAIIGATWIGLKGLKRLRSKSTHSAG